MIKIRDSIQETYISVRQYWMIKITPKEDLMEDIDTEKPYGEELEQKDLTIDVPHEDVWFMVC